MFQLQEAQGREDVDVWMTDMCDDLFQEWLVDLTQEEKEVWLWNSLVELKKIRQRRKP